MKNPKYKIQSYDADTVHPKKAIRYKLYKKVWFLFWKQMGVFVTFDSAKKAMHEDVVHAFDNNEIIYYFDDNGEKL